MRKPRLRHLQSEPSPSSGSRGRARQAPLSRSAPQTPAQWHDGAAPDGRSACDREQPPQPNSALHASLSRTEQRPRTAVRSAGAGSTKRRPCRSVLVARSVRSATPRFATRGTGVGVPGARRCAASPRCGGCAGAGRRAGNQGRGRASRQRSRGGRRRDRLSPGTWGRRSIGSRRPSGPRRRARRAHALEERDELRRVRRHRLVVGLPGRELFLGWRARGHPAPAP